MRLSGPTVINITCLSSMKMKKVCDLLVIAVILIKAKNNYFKLL